MKIDTLFSMASPLRDEFRIQGYRFGSGKRSLAIVGAMRGDEIEQQYICARMVSMLQKMEMEGDLVPGHEILVIPNANHFSMNIGKRFWAMDNTDINRMFPGYDRGETTQRIAAALFKQLEGFEYGIQMASFYIPGDFIPHVRMMETGYEPVKEAGLFGLPYVYVKSPRPFDTTILNYNWQIWNTKAFSLYAGQLENISEARTLEAFRAILRFMDSTGMVKMTSRPGYQSTVIRDGDLVNVKAEAAGLYVMRRRAREEVRVGDVLGEILDPYDCRRRMEVKAPVDGTIFFAHDKPLVLQNTLLYKIIE